MTEGRTWLAVAVTDDEEITRLQEWEQRIRREALEEAAFSRWLMGYPAAWDDCAAMVTPSSRRSRKPSLKP